MSSLISTRSKEAPASANLNAIALPIPAAEPVIRALCFSKKSDLR